MHPIIVAFFVFELLSPLFSLSLSCVTALPSERAAFKGGHVRHELVLFIAWLGRYACNELCNEPDVVQWWLSWSGDGVFAETAGSDEPNPTQAMLPDIQLKLGNDSFEPALCEFHVGAYAQTTYLNGTMDSFLDDAMPTRDGKFTRTFLFRNFAACVGSSSALANISSIGFFSRTSDVSFCIEDFNLLLTEVPSPGESVSNRQCLSLS